MLIFSIIIFWLHFFAYFRYKLFFAIFFLHTLDINYSLHLILLWSIFMARSRIKIVF
jgi:hypothetical protein